MSHFKAKMHQNRFRLGLRPRPRWGPYSAPPDPLAVFKGPTSKGKEGAGEERRESEEEGKGKGREGENDLTHPCRKFLATPLRARRRVTSLIRHNALTTDRPSHHP